MAAQMLGIARKRLIIYLTCYGTVLNPSTIQRFVFVWQWTVSTQIVPSITFG